MNKKSNSLITLALTGIGIGIPITLVCMILIGGFNGIIKEFFVWTIASALFGILSGVIFNEKNEISLPIALILHFSGCLTITTIACSIIGYTNSILDFLKAIFPIFAIIYVVVYVLIFLLSKLEEKKINEMLKHE